MQLQFSLVQIPLILATLVSLWIANYAWPRRNSLEPPFLSILALAIAEWLVGYGFEIAATEMAAKLFFAKLEYVGISLVPLMWFLFVLRHAKSNQRLRIGTRILLLLIPAATMLFAFTADLHDLLWRSISVSQGDGFSVLKFTYGYWFWVHSAYSYILILAGTLLVVLSLGQRKGTYRGQTVALLVAVLAPWVGNVLYLSGLSPVPHLDLTPFMFTLSLVALTWAILGYQLADLSPFAREFVVDHLADGVIVFNSQSRVTDINQKAQEILAHPTGWAIGRDVETILSFSPGLAEKFRLGEENLGVVELKGINSQWLDLRLSVLRGMQQNELGRVVTLYDITRRRQSEEALALARDQALEASQFKSQLLAKVSHELRTPLGSILGFAELLKYGVLGPVNPKQEDAIGQVIDSVNFLTELVNDLLDEAQISARKMVLHIEPFSLAEMAGQVEARMAVLAKNKEIGFNLSIDRRLPAVLDGDMNRLQQILINLCGNAVKFTRSGNVTVEIYPLETKCWGMRVSDTGIGIPQEALQMIFDPFRQVGNPLQSEHRGSGLGLAITKQLVELMGGRISVESKLGSGSTFTVVLPLIVAQES
jgi:signal transduction histidine kinase